MYKIGEFSKLSKTTIKALRYYEKEGLLKPTFMIIPKYLLRNELIIYVNCLIVKYIW